MLKSEPNLEQLKKAKDHITSAAPLIFQTLHENNGTLTKEDREMFQKYESQLLEMADKLQWWMSAKTKDSRRIK